MNTFMEGKRSNTTCLTCEAPTGLQMRARIMIQVLGTHLSDGEGRRLCLSMAS